MPKTRPTKPQQRTQRTTATKKNHPIRPPTSAKAQRDARVRFTAAELLRRDPEIPQFPPEIWLRIIKMADPRDWESIAGVSPFHRALVYKVLTDQQRVLDDQERAYQDFKRRYGRVRHDLDRDRQRLIDESTPGSRVPYMKESNVSRQTWQWISYVRELVKNYQKTKERFGKFTFGKRRGEHRWDSCVRDCIQMDIEGVMFMPPLPTPAPWLNPTTTFVRRPSHRLMSDFLSATDPSPCTALYDILLHGNKFMY